LVSALALAENERALSSSQHWSLYPKNSRSAQVVDNTLPWSQAHVGFSFGGAAYNFLTAIAMDLRLSHHEG
jgi:hypothetical protein